MTPNIPHTPRIGENHNREGALLDLHHFLLDNPEVDLNSFLSAASDTFRSYIYKGLAKVRVQLQYQQGGGGGASRPATAPSGLDKENSPAEAAAMSAAARPSSAANLAELRDRLNKTQASAGMNTARWAASEEP